MTKDDEDKQNPERGGWQREEVNGHQVLDMIVEKAPPRLRRWTAMVNHVLGYGGRGNGDAELRELAVHAGRSPERIGSTHVTDQLAYFGSDAGSTRPAPPALPCPVAFEPGAVPPDNGLGLHDDEDPGPVGPESSQQHPETTVHIRQPQSFHRTLEDGELLAQSEIFKSQ